MDEIKEAIRSLRDAHPDTDIIVISHEINRSLYYKLSEKLDARRGPTPLKCVVFLNTLGGDPHAGFRIARCLRHHYKGNFRLVIPHHCKSAGTLIAIGASQLAIGDLGELGPLDVQISKRTELLERSSGLDFNEALTAMLAHGQAAFRRNLLEICAGAGISTKMAGEFATQLAVGMVSPMYAQIDPLQVGEVHRAMKIAFEYGTRLNDDSKQLYPDALESLVSAYPDHGFVIDRKEAKKLFKSVESPTDAEARFANTLWEVFRHEANWCHIFDHKPEMTQENEDESTNDEKADEPGSPEVGPDTKPAEDGGTAAEADGSLVRPDEEADTDQDTGNEPSKA